MKQTFKEFKWKTTLYKSLPRNKTTTNHRREQVRGVEEVRGANGVLERRARGRRRGASATQQTGSPGAVFLRVRGRALGTPSTPSGGT